VLANDISNGSDINEQLCPAESHQFQAVVIAMMVLAVQSKLWPR